MIQKTQQHALLYAERWKSSAPIHLLLIHHTTKLSVSSDCFLYSKYDELFLKGHHGLTRVKQIALKRLSMKYIKNE